MSATYNVRFAQMTAYKRAVELRGWSLPARGSQLVGDQRVEIDFFNGNPVAVAQVNGPTLLPTNFSGIFREFRYVDGASAPILENFPAIQDRFDGARSGGVFAGSGSIPRQEAATAEASVAALDLMRKEGQLIRFEWGPYSRYGIIKQFSFTLENIEDIPWEMEIGWIGEEANQPVPAPRERFETIATKQTMETHREKLEFAFFGIGNDFSLPFLGALFQGRLFVLGVTQRVQRLTSLLTELIDTMGLVVDLAYAPIQVIGQLRSGFTQVRLAALDLMDGLSEYGAAVDGALTANPLQISIGTTMQQRLRQIAQETGAFAAQNEAQLAKHDIPEIVGIHIMKRTTTLRDVARTHTGSADNWKAIARFNGFRGSLVEAGTVVRIPKI